MKILILSKTYFPNSYRSIEKFIDQIANIKCRNHLITVCRIIKDNTIKKIFLLIVVNYINKSLHIQLRLINIKIYFKNLLTKNL